MNSFGSSNALFGGSSHTLVCLQVPVTATLLNEKLGSIRIGELLKHMDIAACMSAERHSLRTSVTLSMDDVNLSDARSHTGDVIVIRSRLNRAFKTSMEIGLRCEIETPETGLTRHLCSSYFVFVALDEQGKKVEVAPMVPVTEKEKVRWALAQDRRQIRLDHARIIQQVVKEKATGLRYSITSPAAKSGMANARSSVAFGGEADDRKNEVTQMVMPQHANHYGNTFGGQVMCWAHEAAEVAAARHARIPVVTVSVDDIFFLAPSKVGTRVVLKASVNRVFNRSMEVGVKVEGHHLNGEIVLINRAFFTMVAVSPPTLSPAITSPMMLSTGPVRKLSSSTTLSSSSGGKSSLFKFASKPSSSKQSPNMADPASPSVPATVPESGDPQDASTHAVRSVPLSTPDQVRRHQEALGRRRVRLERLQLKKSNHLAWPFTPDTNPRSFMLENLKALERATLGNADIAATGETSLLHIKESPTLNRGDWGLVGESDGIQVMAKTSLTHGVSMKSHCVIPPGVPFDAVVFAVWDVGSRKKWDKVVVACEMKHSFSPGLANSDIVWLAIDTRAIDPKSKPTDFALLRSWKLNQSTFCIASHSVIHHSIPSSTQYVRAETASAGFILHDLGPNKGVDVSYIVQLNQSGTSIVASELVGSSRIYAARMKELMTYAKSLSPEVYSIPIKKMREDEMKNDDGLNAAAAALLTSDQVFSNKEESDRHCTIS